MVCSKTLMLSMATASALCGTVCAGTAGASSHVHLHVVHNNKALDQVLLPWNETETKLPRERFCVQDNQQVVCQEILYQLCGTDGQTYENGCYLVHATCQNPKLKLAHVGACKEKEEEEEEEEDSSEEEEAFGCHPGDSCLDVYEPVCGSDGKTYSNDCYLTLQACKDKSLKKVKDGECDNQDKKQRRTGHHHKQHHKARPTTSTRRATKTTKNSLIVKGH